MLAEGRRQRRETLWAAQSRPGRRKFSTDSLRIFEFMVQAPVRKRLLAAGSEWLWDKALGHWPEILVSVIGGGGMAYLARASAWLAPYGPVAWGGVGILALLLIALAYFLTTAGTARRRLSTYVVTKGSASTVNVLAPVHQDERVELSDFYHPYFHPTESVRFEHCELLGPANVVFDGGTISQSSLIDCEIVIVRADRPVKGASLFRNCLIVRSRLYRVTLLMNHDTYRGLAPDMRSGVPVISDGRIGDV